MLVIYDFIMSLQEKIGCDCRVSVSSFNYGVPALSIQIDWPNDFHVRHVVSESELKTNSDIKMFEERLVWYAENEYKKFEVGEI